MFKLLWTLDPQIRSFDAAAAVVKQSEGASFVAPKEEV